MPPLDTLRDSCRRLSAQRTEPTYNADAFADAVQAYLSALGKCPGGIEALQERGEFVARKTAPGSTYSRLAKETRRAIGSALKRSTLPGNSGVWEQFPSALSLFVEQPTANLGFDRLCTARELIRRMFSDTSSDAPGVGESTISKLRHLLDEADAIYAEAVNCCAKGCEWLLSVQKERSASFRSALIRSNFGEEPARHIQEAANGLLAELELAVRHLPQSGGFDATHAPTRTAEPDSPSALPKVDSDKRWITVSAAAGVTSVSRGTISRAVNTGELKSNGLSKRQRRIDAVDLVRWAVERSNRPAPQENPETIRRQLSQLSDD